MKVFADALLKDLHKLSVDELIGLQLSVQKFGFAPEVKQEVLAKIQKRALSLMDRLNKQPNILADYETAEKLVNVFGEYNHERKLIYPVAHSLKIKIRKAKYYLEKNPEYGSVLCGVLKVRSGICWEVVLPPSGDMVKALFMSETALGTGSNLFARTHLIRKINGFDESFLRHQDIEFGVRRFSQSKVFRIREIQIVKAMDGFSNAPDFERFLKTKRHFMDKFGGELKKMTEEER